MVFRAGYIFTVIVLLLLSSTVHAESLEYCAELFDEIEEKPSSYIYHNMMGRIERCDKVIPDYKSNLLQRPEIRNEVANYKKKWAKATKKNDPASNSAQPIVAIQNFSQSSLNPSKYPQNKVTHTPPLHNYEIYAEFLRNQSRLNSKLAKEMSAASRLSEVELKDMQQKVNVQRGEMEESRKRHQEAISKVLEQMGDLAVISYMVLGPDYDSRELKYINKRINDLKIEFSINRKQQYESIGFIVNRISESLFAVNVKIYGNRIEKVKKAMEAYEGISEGDLIAETIHEGKEFADIVHYSKEIPQLAMIIDAVEVYDKIQLYRNNALKNDLIINELALLNKKRIGIEKNLKVWN